MQGCTTKVIDVFASSMVNFVEPANFVQPFNAGLMSHTLPVKLDVGVKAVHSITLVAYTIKHADRGVDPMQELTAILVSDADEVASTVPTFANDDFITLTIDEVQGDVISNVPEARGAFAVLSNVRANLSNYLEPFIHQRHAEGIVTHVFEQPKTDIRTLTLRCFTSRGEPWVDKGRIHLWFKLCVSHG